jgi:hypothetical protein
VEGPNIVEDVEKTDYHAAEENVAAAGGSARIENTR